MEKQIKLFLEFLQYDKKLSENTLQSYNRDISQFKDYVKANELNYSKITEEDVKNYLKYLKKIGKKPSTMSRSLATIRSFYQYLVRVKKVKKDPTENIKSPKIEKKVPSVLTTDEVDLLLDQPKDVDLKGTRDKAMLELAYATGMKVTEIIDLNVEDVDFENGTVTCSEAKRSREIPISLVAQKALKEYIDSARPILINNDKEKALFVNMNGKRLTRQGFWKIVKYYQEKAHIEKDITPHVLRHSFAMHLIQSGANLKSIQVVLGHADVSSTQIYKQFATNDKLNEINRKTNPRV